MKLFREEVFEKIVPVFRIFDLEKAREFYIDFLGFKENWLHRFKENGPVYMEIERNEFRIHLSEHHGDGTPGSSVYVLMRRGQKVSRRNFGKGLQLFKSGNRKNFLWHTLRSSARPIQ